MYRKNPGSFGKKSIFGIIALIITVAGLGFALTLQQSVVNFWPSADVNKDTTFSRSQCLKTKNCFGISSKDQKTKCYDSCNKQSQQVSIASGSKQIDPNYAKDSHKLFIDHFMRLYGSTNFGRWRAAAIQDRNSVDTNYYRVVCNIASVGAFKAIKEGKSKNDPVFSTYSDRLMAVMDEYDIWSAGDAKWTIGVEGYSCLMASSLLWDKIPSATAWDKASAQLKIGVNTNPNRSADEKRRYLKQRFEQIADIIARDFTVDYFRGEQNRRISNNKGSDIGNSVAEEAGWNGAYLALAAEVLSINDIKKELYQKTAKDLIKFSMEKGTIKRNFPVRNDNFVINHNMSPHPQYGFSILSTTARASLAQFKFGKNDRNKMFSEYRRFDTDKNLFSWVDMFETQLTMVNKQDFTLKGRTCQFSNTRNCKNFQDIVYNVPPYQFKGVSDWGTGIWFQNSVFAFSYVLDLYDWNGHRAGDSPYGSLLKYQRSKVDAKQLNLPSLYKDGKWSYEPLPDAKQVKVGFLSETFGGQQTNTDVQTNTHFFLNSIAAFEDVMSYMFMDTDQWIRKIN